jgi:hypothetical protein
LAVVRKTERRRSARSSIPSCIRNLGGLSGEGADLGILRQSRRASWGGARFGCVRDISAGFSERRPISASSRKTEASFSARRSNSSRSGWSSRAYRRGGRVSESKVEQPRRRGRFGHGPERRRRAFRGRRSIRSCSRKSKASVPGRWSISSWVRNPMRASRGEVVGFGTFKKRRRASRGGARIGHARGSRGELLGELVDFVVFQKWGRASRIGARFRHVSEGRGGRHGEVGDFAMLQTVEASFSERRSISSSFGESSRALSERRPNLVTDQTAGASPLVEEGRVRLAPESRGEPSRRGCRFRRAPGTRGEPLGEEVDFGMFQCVSVSLSERRSIWPRLGGPSRASQRGGSISSSVGKPRRAISERWSISSCVRNTRRELYRRGG